MAWRFKVSKYKNAAPLLPKKEAWVSDIKVGAPQSCGNHIKASAAFVAFNVENRGKKSLFRFGMNYIVIFMIFSFYYDALYQLDCI